MMTDELADRPETLPRVLAVILFVLAAAIGIPTALGTLGALISGKWPILLVAGMGLPIVWVATWLGNRLWMGRAIPRRFIIGVVAVCCVLPLVSLIVRGAWLYALGMAYMMSPLLATLPRFRRAVGKPKPRAIDELM